ncbi:MAG TPA: OsmC family protein [Acidimicrobiia bacterium]|nr:OsmC family protein [Acidimicrobiia bacterium]
MGAGAVHRYETWCAWEGSTGAGYESYDRAHTAAAPPALGALSMSADPAFRGDPAGVNPEQLLVLAASSCQLLSFLAVAARARIDVVAYSDRAEAVMPEDDLPVRITSITLRPEIRVRGPVAEDRLRHLCEVAHRECFISNSLTTEVRVEPSFTYDPMAGSSEAGSSEAGSSEAGSG